MREICLNQNDAIDVVLLSLLKLWTDFTHFSGASIFNFEQINTGWEGTTSPEID